MKKQIGKIGYFFITFLICFPLFILPCLFILKSPSKKITTVENTYQEATYNNKKMTIVTNIIDLSMIFIVDFFTLNNSFEVICFPSNSVHKSNTYFNEKDIKKSVETFTLKKVDRYITINSLCLSKIIDSVGGIVTPTPYGVPSPAGENILVGFNETVNLYGYSVTTLLKENNKDYEQFIYCAKLFGLTISKYLNNFKEDKFLFLSQNSKTDITFADYVNNKNAIESCADNGSYASLKGNFINDYYYLF